MAKRVFEKKKLSLTDRRLNMSKSKKKFVKLERSYLRPRT